MRNSITEEILKGQSSRQLANIATLCTGIIAERLDNKTLKEVKVNKNGR